MESVLVLSQSSHHNWCRDQDFLLSTGGGRLRQEFVIRRNTQTDSYSFVAGAKESLIR